MKGNSTLPQFCGLFTVHVNIFIVPLENIFECIPACKERHSDLHTYSFFKTRGIEILNIEEVGPPVFFTGGVGNKLIDKWSIS